MNYLYRTTVLLLATLITQTGAAQTLADDTKWLIELSGMYGQASGRLQTPAGGREGSVTPAEPQFDESGTLSAEFFIGRRLGQHLVFFNYRNWGFEGTDTYSSLPQNNETLWGNECVTIQNSVFCNGDTVEARVDMDWFSLGYGYTFNFSLNGGRQLMVTPWVQADLYRFEMEMQRQSIPADATHGDQPGEVDRKYNKGGLRIGGVIEYAQNDWLVWGTRLATSFVLPSAPSSSDIQLYAGFRLWNTAHTRGNLRAGVGYTYFRYTDQQTVPNDLVAELGPSPLLALAVQF